MTFAFDSLIPISTILSLCAQADQASRHVSYSSRISHRLRAAAISETVPMDGRRRHDGVYTYDRGQRRSTTRRPHQHAC